MPVADARAEMRRTLELATKGSVVLTTHGEPAAAVVPFTTLEDMKRALLHLLVAEMKTTFARTEERAKSREWRLQLPGMKRWKSWLVKHCAELDDAVVNLLARIRSHWVSTISRGAAALAAGIRFDDNHA